MLLNSVANPSMECNCISKIVKGVLDPGFFIICINYLAALVACSIVENPGTIRSCGKNSTTSECLSSLVLVI